ncbi:MAG: hypothetical protein AAGB35_10070 [Pseudomonadota bacterium]
MQQKARTGKTYTHERVAEAKLQNNVNYEKHTYRIEVAKLYISLISTVSFIAFVSYQFWQYQTIPDRTPQIDRVTNMLEEIYNSPPYRQILVG